MRVCWHLDGLHVVTGDSKGRISVYTASDGAATATLEASASREEPDEVYGLQMLSIDGLLAAGTGNEVQLWDLAHSTCVARTEFARSEKGCVFGGADRNPEGRAYLFDLVARGRALCAALSDGTIRLLDAQTLQPVGTLTEHSKRGAPVFGVAISPRSPLLATSDGDGTVLVWDLRQAQRGPLAETSRDTAVHALSFVAGVGLSGEMLATGADTTLCVHETHTPSLSVEGSVSVLSTLLCVEAATDDPTARLATAGGSGGLISDASISLWRLEEGARAGGDSADADPDRASSAHAAPPDEREAKRGAEEEGEATRQAEKRARHASDDASGEVCSQATRDEDCCSEDRSQAAAAPRPPPSSEQSSSAPCDGDDRSCAERTTPLTVGLPSQAPSACTGTGTDSVRTRGECEVLVCQAGSCRRAGSEAVLLEIEELGRPFGCSVRPEGCLGACDEAPNVVVLQRDGGDEQLYPRVESVERSAAVVAAATGRTPDLDDPALTQRLGAARQMRARQRAREERKWNAAMKGLAEQITSSADAEAQLELKGELAELLQSAGQWEAALLLCKQLMVADEDVDPDLFMQIGSLLGKLRRLAELDALDEAVRRSFDAPDEAELLSEIQSHLALCRTEALGHTSSTPGRSVEGYAAWTLASVTPASRHSALYRFTSQDARRGTPCPRGDGRAVYHQTWHTTLLAMVGRNSEGPLLWVERDYTPISTWAEWEDGVCEILIKIYPTGAATSWLHKQPVGTTMWLSEPMTTLSVPELVPDPTLLTHAESDYESVLLVLAGTGIVVAPSILHHTHPSTSFGTAAERTAPLTAPIRLIYACRRDDVLMADEIIRWRAEGRLQRCLVAVSAPTAEVRSPTAEVRSPTAEVRSPAAEAAAPTVDVRAALPSAPFATPPSPPNRTSSTVGAAVSAAGDGTSAVGDCISAVRGLDKLSEAADVEVIEGRLTAERLCSELRPLQALGRCRVVVSGPASFNGAVKGMLARSGLGADAVTILEA